MLLPRVIVVVAVDVFSSGDAAGLTVTLNTFSSFLPAESVTTTLMLYGTAAPGLIVVEVVVSETLFFVHSVWLDFL